MKTDVRPSRTGACAAQPRVSLPAGLTLLVACLLCRIFAPIPVLAQDGVVAQLGPEGQAIVQAINEARAQNGLGPLAVHPLLNQAAQNHVDDLIANGMYGHYGSDGSTVRTRVLRTGYPSGWVSENWVTSGSAAGAMTWWMNDWIHRVNILDSSWDEVGVGAGQVSNGYYIFVTDFANTDGKDTYLAAAPAAAPAAAAAPEAAPEFAPTESGEYRVRAGDTLLAIGLRFGVEWQDIAVANGMSERDVLSIGRVLQIPGFAPASSDVPADGRLYTVQAGDTLSGIAARHGIDWNDIAAANRIADFATLQIGMQIRLPGVAEEDAEADGSEADEDEEASAPVTAQATTPANQPIVYTTELLNATPALSQESTGGAAAGTAYTVKEGDTLFSIAARNGVTWQQLADANAMDEDAFLQIGQTLTLPPRANAGAAIAPAPQAGPAAPAATYTVKSGDTIISIALKHGMDWNDLLALNGLDENSLIQVGDVLLLGD